MDRTPRERLVFPLDVADLADARTWIARLRDHVGQPLGSLLPPKLLDAWLGWLDEAAAAAQPVRCRLGWIGAQGEQQLEAHLAPVGEQLVQLVAWPAAQSAPAAEL